MENYLDELNDLVQEINSEDLYCSDVCHDEIGDEWGDDFSEL